MKSQYGALGVRERERERASLAPSKPPSAIFPLLFIRSQSVKREREKEEEDVVRVGKLPSVSLPLPPSLLPGRQGWRARDFGNAMISGGTN